MSDKPPDPLSYEEILKLSDEQYLARFQEKEDLLIIPYFQVSFSWLGKKVLGCPRNQGRCRSCVACVICDSISASLAFQELDMAKRMLTFFSVQHLVDCPRNTRTDVDVAGCKEGTFEELFRFVNKFGLFQEVDYRYASVKRKCMDPNCPEFEGGTKEKRILKRAIRVKIDDYQIEKIKCFEQGKSIIEKSPVGAVIRLTDAFVNLPEKFEGIYEHVDDAPRANSSKEKVSKKEYVARLKATKIKKPEDHAVLIIGHGKENGKEFYLIKNSWGSKWGYLGYAKIAATLIKEVFYPKDPT